MDSDQGKLFIGGISWETSEDKLKDYFGNYGDILQAVVMRDKLTGKPRGFGFVVFADPSVLDTVLQDKHIIDGRTVASIASDFVCIDGGCTPKNRSTLVDAKRALSREEQVSKAGNPSSGRNYGGSGGNIKTKKIFVGGLPPTLTEEGFRLYFEAYGHVTDVVVMYDQQTNRPRGFGFISFDSEDAVDRVLHKIFHDLDGKQVEVKRALPKDSNPGGGRGGSGGGGGSYQGYGGSGGNSSSYEGRMDSNRYMQSQNTGAGGGFPAFGYGYGSAASSAVGYGGYGGYGGGAGGAYGNPSVPNTGYGSGPQGAPRSSWNNSMGYGSAQWSAPNAGAGGPVSVPTAQSPAGGYGNQGYGYGGYGGNDGSYGNPAVYGAVGGRIGSAPNSNSSGGGGGELQSGGGGYMGGNYADANQGWRTDTVNYGAQANAGYGGGYGVGPARQAQQQ